MSTMTNPVPQATRFTRDDAERAYDAWGANCGTGALAAICGLTLDEVRPHMGNFERKGYTNPTLMLDALRSLRAADLIGDWRNIPKRAGIIFGVDWPNYGLCRVQWEGPWTKPGVPMRVRYRHTHWIGVAHRADDGDDVGIFDINMMNNGQGWGSLHNWRTILVPWILKECVPRADGKWHITHAIEVRPS